MYLCDETTQHEQKIKQRDNSKGGEYTVKSRLSNHVRKMISAIKNDDLQRLIKIIEKNAKKKIFKQVDPVLISAQKNDLELIKKHILELEMLAKRNYERDALNEREDSTLTLHFLEGADELDMENENSGLSGVVLEQDLPDDATRSTLPNIDISIAMLKVQDIQTQIDQGSKGVSNLIADLYQASINIGSELSEQNMLLKNIEDKVDKEIDRLKYQNERVYNALDKVGGSNWIMCIICMVIIIVVCTAAALIFLISYF